MDNLINTIIGKINYVIEKSNESVDSVNKITSQIDTNDSVIKNINSDNKEIIKHNKDNYLEKPDDESVINKSNDSTYKTKIWYTHYRSYIVKSVLDTETGNIYEDIIPYNQPSNFRNFLDNYFANDLN